mgnify:CR=1 FL=1
MMLTERPSTRKAFTVKKLENIEDVSEVLAVPVCTLLGGLNLVQMGEILGISPSTVRQKALDGQIGYCRFGRSWKFYWWSLAAYFNEHYVEPIAPPEARSIADSEAHDFMDWEAEARELGLL